MRSNREPHGWGTALVFDYNKEKGSLTITSYGADMKSGGLGLNADIILNINQSRYMAPLSLSLKGRESDIDGSELEINYPDPENGALKTMTLDLDSIAVSNGDDPITFGRFVSEEDSCFPVGIRSIRCLIRRGNDSEVKTIVFSHQPGMNCLGLLE